MRRLYFLSIVFLSILIYSSCKHDPDLQKQPNNDFIYVEYLVDTIYSEQGIGISSSKPIVVGKKPINFKVSSIPTLSNSQISIDSLGIITVDSSVVEGNYSISVNATNEEGTAEFKDVLTVIITRAIPPSNLIYSPSSMTIASGELAVSGIPTYQGSKPISFSVSSTPSAGFTIDSSGVIAINGSLSDGTYILDVTLSNVADTVTFQGAFTVTIKSATELTELVYPTSTLILNDGEGGKSMAPEIQGTGPISYNLITSPSTPYITIDINTGIIFIDDNILPGTYIVSVAATNSLGTYIFENVYTIVINPVLPTNLVYSPRSMGLLLGSSGTSSSPSISGTTPVSYTMNTSPATTEITIDSNTGIITASSATPEGVYYVHIYVSNSAGTSTFVNAYMIQVSSTSILPQNLIYSPNELVLDYGNAGNSSTPEIIGTTPITYTFESFPASSAISINENTGVINVSGATSVGDYNITVTATNVAGSASFSDAFSVTINSSNPPTALSYFPSSVTVTQGNSSISSIPNVSGTMPITYSMTVNPSSSEISIDGNTGEIISTSSLTTGTYNITVTATNNAGTTVFDNVYSIIVDGPVIAPSSLIYIPNSMSISEGITMSSSVPAISGTLPISYTINVSPSSQGISINTETGVITVYGTTPVGTYSVEVTASNPSGSTSATFTVDVITSLVSYAADIKPILAPKCGSCHTKYKNYTGTKADINLIINRINRAQGSAGFMPKNGNKLPQSQLDLIQQWLDDGLQP